MRIVIVVGTGAKSLNDLTEAANALLDQHNDVDIYQKTHQDLVKLS
jgi:hypothetical protein